VATSPKSGSAPAKYLVEKSRQMGFVLALLGLAGAASGQNSPSVLPSAAPTGSPLQSAAPAAPPAQPAPPVDPVDPDGPEPEPQQDQEPPSPARHAEAPLERQKLPLQNGMLRIPGAEFVMGFDGGPPGEPNEKPAHIVRVAPFWIDRTEVTVEDMRACINRGACNVRLGTGPTCNFSRAEPRAPINCVPWQSADAYCRAVGKRLPTEAEWELAAGGAKSRFFPWGTAYPTCAHAVTLLNNRAGVSCSARGPTVVGSHPKGASYFGVEDMAGNVEEWVADWYGDKYEVRPQPRPTSSPSGPAFGVAHVIRGGGWMSRPREARVTARSWGSPNEAGPNVGFRCARD
jgi:serine/threonine-protein kinase